jgi:CHAT domain-containing protein/tetratricopeptide (TPR) repeat protein
MKICVIFLFAITIFFDSNAQSIKKINNQFWNAIDTENHLEIASNGSKIIEYLKKDKFISDTIIIFIRIRTAYSYANIGMEAEALKLNLTSLQFVDSVWGQQDKNYITLLNNISVNYLNLGDYKKSMLYNTKALEIHESIYDKKHPLYSICINTFSINFERLGDLKTAIDYSKRGLNIQKKTLGDEHPIYAKSLNNISVLYAMHGDCQTALEFNNLALSIQERTVGLEHPDFALSLNNKACYLSKLGNYEKAMDYFVRVLDIQKRTLGEAHPEYALTLSNIGNLYCKLGDYNKALEYNDLVIKIWDKALGKEHLEYALCLLERAKCYYNLHENNNAINDLRDFYSIIEKNYFENWSLSNELQRTNKYQLENSFYLLANVLKNDSSAREVCEKWLSLNGILSTNSTLNERKFTENGESTHYQWEYLKSKKRELNQFQELPKSKKNQNLEYEESLKKEIGILEAQLNEKSTNYADFKRRIHSVDIRQKLEMGEMYIDVVRIPNFNFSLDKWTDSCRYLIFIINPMENAINHFFINNGFELENDLLVEYKMQATDNKNATDLKNDLFYNSFWKPIADKIGDAKTIYVSLGGVYNNINLNTLYNPETGKYLIEEKDIRIVNSARDFVFSQEREKKQYTSTNSALYGFPDFNGSTTSSFDTTNYLAATRDLNQMWIDSLTRGGMKAASLPATKIEVDQIERTFQLNGWNVKTYSGVDASETNIKKEVSPRVLHIATHGYFFEDIPMDNSNDRFFGIDRQRVMQDPMLRSGLLFTGANRTLQGEESKGENGLLSSAEASLLDLRETELVVLSACETGKGEVKNSEGVYGLRKAFADAGAKNIIMSLWKVDDKVTQEFMSRFYENWLNEKTTIREAVNRTQLEIKAKYPQPYYWGAFILVGE